MTPLLADIEALESMAARIRAGRQCDDLDSLAHVKLIGLFRRLHGDPEIMAQIRYQQTTARLREGGNE